MLLIVLFLILFICFLCIVCGNHNIVVTSLSNMQHMYTSAVCIILHNVHIYIYIYFYMVDI